MNSPDRDEKAELCNNIHSNNNSLNSNTSSVVVSKLAKEIKRIAVNNNPGSLSEDERRTESMFSTMGTTTSNTSSVITNHFHFGAFSTASATAAYAKQPQQQQQQQGYGTTSSSATSAAATCASQHTNNTTASGGSNSMNATNFDKSNNNTQQQQQHHQNPHRYKHNYEMSAEEDCDRSVRSQSSISGASLEFQRGRRSSLRISRGSANYHRRMANTDGYGSLTDDNTVVSFSMIKRMEKASQHAHGSGGSGHEVNMMVTTNSSGVGASAAAAGGGGEIAMASSAQLNDSASQASQTDTVSCHDEGYLSQSTAEGYQSGGYHSYHPALSYAPSVKSDIATVCSGSVVEDIDMAEMASVASEASGSRPASRQVERGSSLERTRKTATVAFAASNILSNMGPPPPLCSALLLAANAACRPSSRGSDGEADSRASTVGAHVDTDDCCDRSIIESEAASEHKEGHFDEASRSPVEAMNASDPSSPTTGNASPGGKGYVEELPLQRFRQGLDQVDNPNLPPDDDPLLVECGAEFNPWSGEYSDRRREDDWSNSRSHSRSPSRSLSPSSSRGSRSRSRSRSRSPDPDRNCRRTRPSWYREREQIRLPPRQDIGVRSSPSPTGKSVEDMMEEAEIGSTNST